MRYVSLFISNWLWIAAALFIALSVAWVYNRYSQRVYNVKSTLQIQEEQQSGGIASMEQIFAGNYYNAWPNLDDEVAVLQSYTLNRLVMDEMPELHVAYLPVNRKGIQGQRMYKNSPFVVNKLSESQPTGVPMTIRFTGPDSWTVEIDREYLDKMEERARETNGQQSSGSADRGSGPGISPW